MKCAKCGNEFEVSSLDLIRQMAGLGMKASQNMGDINTLLDEVHEESLKRIFRLQLAQEPPGGRRREPSRTVEQHANFLNERGSAGFPTERSGSGRVEYTTCDPSGASARATLLENRIPTLAVRSGILQGLEVVREQLKVRADGKPGFYASSRCVETIKEFNLYSYPESSISEEPVKEHDHAMDAIRYFVVNWRRGYINQQPGRYG